MSDKRYQKEPQCLYCQKGQRGLVFQDICQNCKRLELVNSPLSLSELVSKSSPNYHRSFSNLPNFQPLDATASFFQIPTPTVKVSISRLENFSPSFSNELSKERSEKNEEIGEYPLNKTYQEPPTRIHTHRLLTNYTPIPRCVPTPPPTPQYNCKAYVLEVLSAEPK
jgi:hypothetical protein